MKEPLLQIRDLKTYFFMSMGVVRAVDGVDLMINRGETVGLVGESGCGKSATALSIMKLIPSPPGRIVSGQILFTGEDLVKMTEAEMRRMRGGKIAMSFQDPLTYLNPVKKVGDQIAEAIVLHQSVDKKEALERAVKMMERVKIPLASERAMNFPHQLSGGMRQRIMLAMAISCRPSLLIADEPTTALDVIIQDEILDLIADLKNELSGSTFLITHDLGIVATLSDRVAVMYAGKIVELGDKFSLFKKPLHPYTRGLLESIPRLDAGKTKLKSIGGGVPSLIDPPSGCRFHPRCPYAKEICTTIAPELQEVDDGRLVACLLQQN